MKIIPESSFSSLLLFKSQLVASSRPPNSKKQELYLERAQAARKSKATPSIEDAEPSDVSADIETNNLRASSSFVES